MTGCAETCILQCEACRGHSSLAGPPDPLPFLADPGAIVEAQTSVPYAIVGGILALLVFLVICVLIVMVWCSIRQKGQCLEVGWEGPGVWRGAARGGWNCGLRAGWA